MQISATIKRDKKNEKIVFSVETISLSSVLPGNLSGIQKAQLQTLQLKPAKPKGAFIWLRAKWIEERGTQLHSTPLNFRDTKTKQKQHFP